MKQEYPTKGPLMAACVSLPKASVYMVTYNHEKYIAQALDSVLVQKTNFPYEVVIGEDHSTDRTRSIIIEYQNRYPEMIHLLPLAANMGVLRNMARTLKACRGQYVAVLEGDDYWTSLDKLQKQVDFLDSHPDYAICFHNSRVVFDDGSREPGYWAKNPKETSTIEDLLRGNFIPHSAEMFRNGLFNAFPDWFFALDESGDWPLNIFNAEHGKIGCLSEIMAVYRVHAGSVWSSRTEERKVMSVLSTLDYLDVHLGFAYHSAVSEMRLKNYRHLVAAYEVLRDRVKAKACFRQVLRQNSSLGRLPSAWELKSAVRLYLAGPYYLLKSLKPGLKRHRELRS